MIFTFQTFSKVKARVNWNFSAFYGSFFILEKMRKVLFYRVNELDLSILIKIPKSQVIRPFPALRKSERKLLHNLSKKQNPKYQQFKCAQIHGVLTSKVIYLLDMVSNFSELGSYANMTRHVKSCTKNYAKGTVGKFLITSNFSKM